jgi:hypothetical protein
VSERCVMKKDSNPPVCGAHNMALIKKQLSNEFIATGYRGFTFLVCPVSGQVLNDEGTNREPSNPDAASGG